MHRMNAQHFDPYPADPSLLIDVFLRDEPEDDEEEDEEERNDEDEDDGDEGYSE